MRHSFCTNNTSNYDTILPYTKKGAKDDTSNRNNTTDRFEDRGYSKPAGRVEGVSRYIQSIVLPE
jgi:hypothetical protein